MPPDDAPAPLGARQAVVALCHASEDRCRDRANSILSALRTFIVAGDHMTVHLSPCPIDRALKSRQADIEAAMLRYLCADVPPAEAAETGAAAKRLVEFLIASLENSDTLPDEAIVPNEFRAHFSRFGDGLRPIIKDIFGDAADDPSLARITDGYWHAVRSQA